MAIFLMTGRVGTITGTVIFPALINYGCLPPFLVIGAVLSGNYVFLLTSCCVPFKAGYAAGTVLRLCSSHIRGGTQRCALSCLKIENNLFSRVTIEIRTHYFCHLWENKLNFNGLSHLLWQHLVILNHLNDDEFSYLFQK